MKVEKSSEYPLLPRRQLDTATRQHAVTGQNGLGADDVALTQPVRVGQSVLYVSLSKTLSFAETSFRAADKANAATNDDETVVPTEDNPLGFDYKKVAKNVLGFVTGYIRKAQADGADEDKLNALLEQARKGIDSGFGQARDELKGMGMFSEDLDKGITKSYDRIQRGLKEFEDELFGRNDNSSEEANADTLPLTQGAPAIDKSGALLDLALSNRNQASVDLVTKEGDKVSIRFDDQSGWRYQNSSGAHRKALAAYSDTERDMKNSDAVSNKSAAHRNDSQQNAVYYSRTSSFSFAVEGNLNQDELASIGALVENMGSLADRFFGGDVTGALDQAKSLNLDNSQVVSLALELRQNHSWSATSGLPPQVPTPQSVNEVTGVNGSDTGTDLSSLFGPFADYLQRLQEMVSQANTLFDPEQQNSLTSWVLNQRENTTEEGKKFLGFNAYLQGMLQQLADS